MTLLSRSDGRRLPGDGRRKTVTGALTRGRFRAARLGRTDQALSQREVYMATIEKSIDVGVPVSVAYGQWTQFEEFPKFMEGVVS
jgi:hypothetical protein